MSYKNKYFDPVNYSLTWAENENFNEFLNELTDVPESKSLNNINITQAGIANQSINLKIRWFQNEIATVYCEVELSVSLHWHRWIHMSRCEEVLFDASEQIFDNLDKAAIYIAEWLKMKQWAQSSFVKIRAIYFMPHLTHKTNRTSYDKVYLISDVALRENKLNLKTWVQAYNITACPCTRTYTKFSVVPKLYDLGLSTDIINKILSTTLTGTHTQRGTIKLLIENNEQKVTHFDLFGVINEATHLIFDLLKRPDEHDLVVRALSRPQFTEDVSRDVVEVLVKWLKDKIDDSAYILVESILNDSIHIHDVKTVIESEFLKLVTEYTNE